jgi:transcriptional regulator with XRE-family HTH domain
MRTRAKLTLAEMARLCSLSRKVSVQYLSQMERGERVFQPEFMALYVRLFTRYTKAGDES